MILESIREELEYNRERALYESVDVKELLEENNELLEEMVDIFLDKLNEEGIIDESYFDDLKIKKEDLAEPNKVKAIIKRIEDEAITPSNKDNLLNWLYTFLLLMVGSAPGIGITAIGGVLNNVMFMAIGGLVYMIGLVIAGLSTDRYNKYISKTEKAIKKVEKKIEKEKDPKHIKVYKDQKEALEKNLKLFKDANLKAKKEIKDGKVRMW
jgi:hypothetical protein